MERKKVDKKHDHESFEVNASVTILEQSIMFVNNLAKSKITYLI